MEEHIAFPHNLTYIHVHKYEGSTSIQSALSKRSTLVKNIQFRVNFDDQLEESVIETHTDVCQYKHSYGGGAMRKKEWWDIERHDHIHSISNLHRTLQLMRYSMITKLHFQSLLCYEIQLRDFCPQYSHALQCRVSYQMPEWTIQSNRRKDSCNISSRAQ